MSKAIQSVHLIAVGDLLIHDACIESAFDASTNQYDFTPAFSYVKHIISSGDIALCNLETTISGSEKKYSGYPHFNAPESLLSAVRDAGFTIASTANNHAVDFGEEGILSTIAALNRNNLLYTGTSSTADQEKRNILLSLKDVKFGINAYTYGTNENEISKDRPWLINMIDFDLIKSDIGYMRDNGAEIVVVCLHAGEEYLTLPDANQKNYVNKLRDLGVDIILGNHPHIVQPAILDLERKNYTIFSLGNFFSNQRDELRDAGVIVDIEINKKFNSVYISNVTYHPTYVHRWEENGKYKFCIIPLREFERFGSMLPQFPFEKAASLLKYMTDHLKKNVNVSF